SHQQGGPQSSVGRSGRVVRMSLNLDRIFKHGLPIRVALAPDLRDGSAGDNCCCTASKSLCDGYIAVYAPAKLPWQMVLGAAPKYRLHECGGKQVGLAGVFHAEIEQRAAVVAVGRDGLAPPVQRVVEVMQFDFLG